MKSNSNTSGGTQGSTKERLKRSDRAARRQEFEAVNNYTKVGHSPKKNVRSMSRGDGSSDSRNFNGVSDGGFGPDE